jgi:hypothetical protein
VLIGNHFAVPVDENDSRFDGLISAIAGIVFKLAFMGGYQPCAIVYAACSVNDGPGDIWGK